MTRPRTLTNKVSRGQNPVSVNQTAATVEETLKQINYITIKRVHEGTVISYWRFQTVESTECFCPQD